MDLPIGLPPEFPLALHRQEHGDAPITSLHRHQCLEIGYCHEGAGIFVVGEKVMEFQGGDVLAVTPDEPHLARSVPGTTSRWTWIYFDAGELLPPGDADGIDRLSGRGFRNLVPSRADPVLGMLAREIDAECRRAAPGYRQAVRGMLSALLARLRRRAPRRARQRGKREEEVFRRIAPALQAMARESGRAADPAAWARACGVSVPHFRRLFREACGQSPHAYLTELRVRFAAGRLRAGREKVVAVAHEAGFETLSSFNRAFRKRMRATPWQWRRGDE